MKLTKKFVRAHKRRKPSGGFTDVRAHARTIKRTIPTTVDDQILDLLLENYLVTEGIDQAKKEFTKAFNEVLSLERGFGKGTPLAKTARKEKQLAYKRLRGLERQQKQIGKQIKSLYESLPQPQKSQIMLQHTRQLEKIRGKPLMS